MASQVICVSEQVLAPDPEHPGKKRLRVAGAVRGTWHIKLVECDHEIVVGLPQLRDGSTWDYSAWEPSPFDARFERCPLCGVVRKCGEPLPKTVTHVLDRGDW